DARAALLLLPHGRNQRCRRTRKRSAAGKIATVKNHCSTKGRASKSSRGKSEPSAQMKAITPATSRGKTDQTNGKSLPTKKRRLRSTTARERRKTIEETPSGAPVRRSRKTPSAKSASGGSSAGR